MATALGVVFSVLVGLPALHVKGLFLAVTTLAFGYMAATWMFARDFWSGGELSVPSGRSEIPTILGVDFAQPKAYFYLCLGFLVLTATVVSHLRRTGAGRTMITGPRRPGR